MRPHEDVHGFIAGGINHEDMARFFFFSLAFDQIRKEEVAGDLVELGVYQGHTATLIATMARRLGRTAWLFDTFEGFSERDLQGIDVAVQGTAFADTSLEAVRAAVGDTNVRFVKGFFPDTANEVPADASFCLVHIDCDLYAPIISSLEFFYPRLAPGGFMIIHDYSSLCWNGAEKAVDEFFADKGEPVIPLPDYSGSVVIRKTRAPRSDSNWLNRKRADCWRMSGYQLPLAAYPTSLEPAGGRRSIGASGEWETPTGCIWLCRLGKAACMNWRSTVTSHCSARERQ